FVGESVIEGEAPHLLRRGLDEALLAEAQRRTPEARHRLDILLAGLVFDADAFPFDDDERSFLLMLAEIGVRVEVIGDIEACEGIAALHALRLAMDWVDPRHYRPAPRQGQIAGTLCRAPFRSGVERVLQPV